MVLQVAVKKVSLRAISDVKRGEDEGDVMERALRDVNLIKIQRSYL